MAAIGWIRLQTYKLCRVIDSQLTKTQIIQTDNTIKDSFRHDIRKYSFSYRIVNIWNSLPDYVVDVDSVDLFKT